MNNQSNPKDQIKYISGSRKITSEPINSQMPTQRQFFQNTQDININNIIQYNNTNFKANSRINIDENQINENEIIRNNKTNPDINNESIKIKDINNNNINNIIPSKSEDLYKSNEEIFKNEDNMSPDEKVLYQSATLDNIQEDQNNILYQSASFNNNEINNIPQQEINSIISQNNQQIQNENYEIGQNYEYSNPNEHIIIERPIKQKEEYDYHKIINQQKEQIKNNPEYEQTQQAQDEEEEHEYENDENINDQTKDMGQVEHKEPKDKDSESEIDPKMQRQQPLTNEYKEIKKYINSNLLPPTNDRVILNKDNNNYYDNQINNNEIENGNNVNNINNGYNINKNKQKYKAKINPNKMKINENNEVIFEKEQEKSKEEQFFAIPLTPSKPIDEETPYNNNSHINKIKFNKNNREIINEIDENINNNIYNYNNENGNEFIEELECKEFEDFSPNAWEKFYQKEERFFKFPEEGITHNQVLINNQNGEIYKGDINKNKEKHGFGKLISPSLKRIGMWRRDNFTGWGREIKENGDIYEGKFINGILNGKGIYKSKNKKTTYIGDYLNSMRHGKGELYTENFHYKGDFKNDKLEGKGKIEIYNEGEYEGTFKDNLFEGKGMLKWKNGNYYIGHVSKGKMNGYGEETFLNGNIYKGYFVNGIKEGKGKIITADGKIIEGIFKNGEMMNNNNSDYKLINKNEN